MNEREAHFFAPFLNNNIKKVKKQEEAKHKRKHRTQTLNTSEHSQHF